MILKGNVKKELKYPHTEKSFLLKVAPSQLQEKHNWLQFYWWLSPNIPSRLGIPPTLGEHPQPHKWIFVIWDSSPERWGHPKVFEGRGLSWKKRKKEANLPGGKARSPEQLWIPGSAPARLGTGAGTVRCPCQGCWLWGDLGSQLFWGSVITKTPKEAQQGSDDKWNNEQPWLGWWWDGNHVCTSGASPSSLPQGLLFTTF